MSLIKKMRKEYALYWQVKNNDSFGKPFYLDPVIIQCRWEDVSVQFVNKNGEVSYSKSTIYVDRDMKTSDYLLYLGKTAPSTIEDKYKKSPLEIEGANEINGFNKLPTLKAKEWLLTAFL